MSSPPRVWCYAGHLALPAVLALAVVLAAWGSAFGLPHIYTPDEAAVVGRAVVMARSADLNPHFFTYPHLVYDLQAALAWLTDRALGAWPALRASSPALAGDGAIYLAARLLGAACATVAVACAYGMGRALTGSVATGLLAALYLAVAPLCVQHAHYATVDMPSAAAAALCGYFCLRALRCAETPGAADRGQTRPYLALSALAAGLAAGAKYNAGLVVLCPLLAMAVVWARRAGRRRLGGLAAGLAGVGLLAALAYLATTPYTLLDWPDFQGGLLGVLRHYGSTGHPGAEGTDNWRWYLAYLAGPGFGVPLLVLAVAGLAAGLLRRRSGQAIVATYCLAYYALLCTGEVRFERNLLPVMPVLAVLAAVTTGDLWQALRAPLGRGPLGRAAGAVVVGGVVLGAAGPPLATAVQLDVSLTHTFTQSLAAAWVTVHVPPGATVATENWEAPPLPARRYRVVHVAALGQHDVSWYRRQRAGYVVADSWTDGAYLGSPRRYAAVVSRYKALFACAQPLAAVRAGSPEAHPGPDFTIYRFPPGGCLSLLPGGHRARSPA